MARTVTALTLALTSILSFCLVFNQDVAADRPTPTAVAISSSPKDEMQVTIDAIIKIVEANPEESQRDLRRTKLRELINPKFNFAEMAKRSLGQNWNEIKPEEQQDFVTVFSELLARTYLSKIETVKTGMVQIDSENIVDQKAVVKTTVMNKGDKFPIDYKLLFSAGRWQVYDVVIENIGLVANYRNEFAGIIRKESFAGLMERLRKKVG
jgi:phospholipid transport system substrate-binding protein